MNSSSKWLSVITFIFSILCSFLLGIFLCKTVHPSLHSTLYDTLVVVDTIRCDVVDCRDSVVLRYISQKLPISNDLNSDSSDSMKLSPCSSDSISLVLRDSSTVIIPIVSKKYEDSLYTAYVSGYHARLDSIFIYPIRTTIRDRPTSKTRDKNFGVGFSIGTGYGFSSRKFEPFVGISIHYNILSF